jgi:hypothetical protein
MNTLNKLKDINEIVDIVLGDEFIVAQKNDGLIEVFDAEFNLLSSNTFTNIDKINANRRVIIIRKDGIVDFYDKWLNYEFSRKIA